MCRQRVHGQDSPLLVLLLRLRKRIHYRSRLVARRARYVSSTLRMAMMCACYHARADTSSTRLALTLGSWSCPARVPSVDTVRRLLLSRFRHSCVGYRYVGVCFFSL